jgi:uncharacterized membrane protein YkvA (DUF1232 family)
MKALLLVLPRLAGMLGALLADRAVPGRAKILLAALAVYLVTPLDLIPDFIPLFGWLDDALLVALVLDRLVTVLGRPLLLKHWPFDVASLDATLATARRVAAWIPRRLKARVVAPRREAA